jgi:hypothetical protein
MDYDFPFSLEFHHPHCRFVIFFRGVGGNHQPGMVCLFFYLKLMVFTDETYDEK